MVPPSPADSKLISHTAGQKDPGDKTPQAKTQVPLCRCREVLYGLARIREKTALKNENKAINPNFIIVTIIKARILDIRCVYEM